MPNNRSLDRWRILANFLFLAYVRKRLSAAPRAWGDFAPYKSSDPSAYPQAAASTRLAVRYKDQFAADMAALEDLPDAAHVRETFADYMRRAEADIAGSLAAP